MKIIEFITENYIIVGFWLGIGLYDLFSTLPARNLPELIGVLISIVIFTLIPMKVHVYIKNKLRNALKPKYDNKI